MKNSTQKGFAHLGVLLLLLIVVVVAFVGYKVSKTHMPSQAPVASVSTKPAQAIPIVKNTADLNTVESTLQSQNIDGNLSPDSFNQDVQSLL